MSRFLFIALSFSSLIYFYLFSRLVWPLSFAIWVKTLLALVLLSPFICMILVPLILWRIPRKRRTQLQLRLMYTSYLLAGGISLLFVTTVARDILALLLFVFFRSGSASFRHELFANVGGLWTLVVAVTLWAVGSREAYRLPRIRRVKVPIPSLAPELEEFQIAQLSDLHVGPSVRRRFVEEVVRTVNDLSPDLIALTGDLVDGHVGDLVEHVEPLKDLKAKEGIFYVTGNHEYYWDGAGWLKHMQSLGMQALANDYRILRRGEARMLIAGIKDLAAYSRSEPMTEGFDLAVWGKELPPSDFKLLLAHQPKVALRAKEGGFHLQLSGHTHGGQFLPWSLVIYFFHEFVHGLNRLESLWIYVSRGTGFWGPPLRLGAPSEITLLTLVTEKR